MRILVDENMPQALVDRLQADGHEVGYVSDLMPGVDDGEVLAESVHYDAVLVTEDKGFGRRIILEGHGTTGVLLVRLPDISVAVRIELIAGVFAAYGDQLIGGFAVLEPGRVRLRRP